MQSYLKESKETKIAEYNFLNKQFFRNKQKPPITGMVLQDGKKFLHRND